MDLSKELISSLQLINNPNNLSDDNFKKLLDNSFAALLNKPDIHNISTLNSSKSDVIKQIYAALLTFIIEIARNDLSIENVSTILNDELKISENRRELFCKMYEKQKDRIQFVLGAIGTHLPHIVEANWKMDYIIQTSSLDRSEGPIFRIQLSTEVYDKNSEEKKIKHIHFNCNTQQLQDLVYKLKDAVKHCEKLASEN